MSAGCVRFVLRSLSINTPACWTSTSRFPTCRGRFDVAASWRCSPFTTDAVQTPAPKKKKAQNPIGSVGRKINHRLVQVLSETGESLGVMHRVDVIKMMDKEGLKLVLLSEDKDPPLYQLMRGKQIYEEQLKQREMKKEKAAPVQVKELSFSRGIGSSDLSTKLKQVESWLEKKHHVKITLRSGQRSPAAGLDKTLEGMVEQMGVTVGFVSRPLVIRDGQAAMCILRPPTRKELSLKEKSKEPESVRTDSPQRNTSSVSGSDSTEGSKQE